MKNAHPSEFLANPERTPNELQTNSKTVPIQARFVVFSNGFSLSQLLIRSAFARVRILHDFGPIFGEKIFQSVFLFHVDSFTFFAIEVGV